LVQVLLPTNLVQLTTSTCIFKVNLDGDCVHI
jgi:hypothetical protein